MFGPLLDAVPEARLTVIGSGSLDPHPRLDHLPWQPTGVLGPLLASHHVGLLPYPSEAPPWLDPLKLHDYRAVGLPSVGSLHPAARGADRQVGLTDLGGWAEAVRTLASQRPEPVVRTWGQAIRAVLD